MPESFEIELRNHPAQAQHPITKKPLFDAKGKPVPLFPDERGIYLDGYLVGYCTAKPGFPVNIIQNVPEAVRQAIVDHVANSFGNVSHSSMVPPPPADGDTDEDE